jgi:hypothetical protein
VKKIVEARKFVGKLTARGPGGAWTFLPIPFSVEDEFGTKSRVSVSGTINGYPFRNSLMPNGDGTHSMAVSRELQAGAKRPETKAARIGKAIALLESGIKAPRSGKL